MGPLLVVSLPGNRLCIRHNATNGGNGVEMTLWTRFDIRHKAALWRKAECAEAMLSAAESTDVAVWRIETANPRGEA